MDTEELEDILGRVAKLVDEATRPDLISRLPESLMPNKVVRDLSKGELLAEVVYFEIRGTVRRKFSWYSYDDDE